jgi:hypothetical protein
MYTEGLFPCAPLTKEAKSLRQPLRATISRATGRVGRTPNLHADSLNELGSIVPMELRAREIFALMP